MSVFSERLEKLLAKNDITAAELSRRTGIPESAISNYRAGKYEAKQRRLEQLARALNTTPAYLMGWVDSPEIPPINYDVDIEVSGTPSPRAQEDIDFIKYGFSPLLLKLFERGDIDEISNEKKDEIAHIVYEMTHLNDDDIKLLRSMAERLAGHADLDVTKKNGGLSALFSLNVPQEKEDEK